MGKSAFDRPALRIGGIAYLNSQPLVHYLPKLAPAAAIVADVPSQLAEGLTAGRLDVAIAPSIELLRIPGASIVSDACVACAGAVKSVRLFGKKPVKEIRTLALDEGSRTSAALVHILLAERFGVRPELRPFPVGTSLDDSTADATLVIGDRGFLASGDSFAFVWDLGEEWWDWTGLPFVFALWIARPGAPTQNLAMILGMARDEGVRHLAEIAAAAAPSAGISVEDCLAYYRENLHFWLGETERKGLALFYELARRHGLAPAVAAVAP